MNWAELEKKNQKWNRKKIILRLTSFQKIYLKKGKKNHRNLYVSQNYLITWLYENNAWEDIL